MPSTVPTTAAFSTNFPPKLSKTEPKSIVFGPVKALAPILPNRLLLNLTFSGFSWLSICNGETFVGCCAVQSDDHDVWCYFN